eukprot:4118621-Amphidinium_carterae.1
MGSAMASISAKLVSESEMPTLQSVDTDTKPESVACGSHLAISSSHIVWHSSAKLRAALEVGFARIIQFNSVMVPSAETKPLLAGT